MKSISLYENTGDAVQHFYALVYDDNGSIKGLGDIVGRPLPTDKPVYSVTTNLDDNILVVANDEGECEAILKRFFVGEDDTIDYDACEGAMIGKSLQFADLLRTDTTTGCLLSTDITCCDEQAGVYDPVGCGDCIFSSTRNLYTNKDNKVCDDGHLVFSGYVSHSDMTYAEREAALNNAIAHAEAANVDEDFDTMDEVVLTGDTIDTIFAPLPAPYDADAFGGLSGDRKAPACNKHFGDFECVDCKNRAWCVGLNEAFNAL